MRFKQKVKTMIKFLKKLFKKKKKKIPKEIFYNAGNKWIKYVRAEGQNEFG